MTKCGYVLCESLRHVAALLTSLGRIEFFEIDNLTCNTSNAATNSVMVPEWMRIVSRPAVRNSRKV